MGQRKRPGAGQPEPGHRHPEHASGTAGAGAERPAAGEPPQRGRGPRDDEGLKEATAVLKDLAAVARSLNDQGVQAEGTESGVVLLPRVEEEEP